MHPIDQMSTAEKDQGQLMLHQSEKRERQGTHFQSCIVGNCSEHEKRSGQLGLQAIERENERETNLNMISGALYHLVATYSVKGAPRSPPNPSGWNPLARPKSQILSY